MEEVRVAFRQQREVFVGDAALESRPAPLHALDQHLRPRLQVDHEVRHRRARRERRVDALVERELVAAEREAREERVLVEQEIRHRRAREEVRLRERLELPRALEEEEELRRQRVARHVLVELAEERVLRRLLEQQFRAHSRAQPPGERGLARADRPLDDVAQPLHR